MQGAYHKSGFHPLTFSAHCCVQREHCPLCPQHSRAGAADGHVAQLDDQRGGIL